MCKQNNPVVPSAIILIAVLSSGCVSRTIKDRPVYKGDGNRKEQLKQSPVVEKKLIWFWQDEYDNP